MPPSPAVIGGLQPISRDTYDDAANDVYIFLVDEQKELMRDLLFSRDDVT